MFGYRHHLRPFMQAVTFYIVNIVIHTSLYYIEVFYTITVHLK